MAYLQLHRSKRGTRIPSTQVSSGRMEKPHYFPSAHPAEQATQSLASDNQSEMHTLREQVRELLVRQATAAHNVALLQAEVHELRMNTEHETLPSYAP